MSAFRTDAHNESFPPKNTYINQHVLRTIGFALGNKSVSSETKKMIQLVRHQFSRKRDSCFSVASIDDKVKDAADQQELLEMVRDNQLDDICGTRPKKAIDRHIDDLLEQYINLVYTSSKCPSE